MLEAVIFDMDGTVLDTLEDLTLSLNAALASCGFASHTQDQVKAMVGNGTERLIDLALPADVAPETRNLVLSRYKDIYREHCNDHAAPYPGILDLLRDLKAAGKRLAVVSNKPDFAVESLAQAHFGNLFDVVIGQSDQLPRKPDPAMVYAALNQLGCTSDQAVYVGDSEVDLEVSSRAGIRCVAVTWGFRTSEQLREAGAGVLIDTCPELMRVLLAL